MSIVSALLPFSPGMGEVLLILAVALLLFGADRLPAIARSLGRWLHTIRQAADTFHDHLLDAADPPAPGDRKGKGDHAASPPDAASCGGVSDGVSLVPSDEPSQQHRESPRDEEPRS